MVGWGGVDTYSKPDTLTFIAFRVGVSWRWAHSRGWATIQINTVTYILDIEK